MPDLHHRDEFADSLARSERRRAQAERTNLQHPALLPRRLRRRAAAIAVLVVCAWFALVYLAAFLATLV